MTATLEGIQQALDFAVAHVLNYANEDERGAKDFAQIPDAAQTYASRAESYRLAAQAIRGIDAAMVLAEAEQAAYETTVDPEEPPRG